MKPSGVLNFENVPEGAGDPDVKVYVNGSEVSAGGGGGGAGYCAVTVTNTEASSNPIELHNIYERSEELPEDVEIYVTPINAVTVDPGESKEVFVAYKSMIYGNTGANISEYSGTIKHYDYEGFYIFYADESGQTLEITLV